MPSIQEVMKQLGQGQARHIVPVSGGKDSAALAIYMRESYPELSVEYVFCDTGCELDETYDYLRQLQLILGQVSIPKVFPPPFFQGKCPN